MENAPKSEPAAAPSRPHYGPESRFKGRKGRSGGAKGNQNSTRHGMRGTKLPKGCQHIENAVNALRRRVEEAVLAAKGLIGVSDAAAINSILKWERHGLLAAYWLRKEAEKLSAADRLRFSEAVAKASDSRDRNIRALGLDRDASEVVFQRLYAAPGGSLPAGKAEAGSAESDLQEGANGKSA